MNIIFLDTETTSNKEDRRMIQLAYKVYEYGKNTQVYNHYYQFDGEISIGAKATHNITETILGEKGIDLKKEFEYNHAYFKDAYIIAHNADFDKETLRIEGYPVDEYKWIDSYLIAYNLIDESLVEAYNLQYLRYFFYPQDIEFSEGITAHDALGDILVLEKVFEQLEILYLTHKKQDGIKNQAMYDQMVEDTNKGMILRVCKFPKHRGKLWKEVEKEDPGFIDWVWKNVDMDKNLQNTILDLKSSR